MRRHAFLWLVCSLCAGLMVMFGATASAQQMDSMVCPEGVQLTETPEMAVLNQFAAAQGVYPIEVLLIQDIMPWDANSNVNALNEAGVGFNLINSASLYTTDLSGYSIVMYASAQWQYYYDNLCGNMSKISAFVEDGGCLLAHACDSGWGGGVWTNCSVLPGGVTHVISYRQDVNVADPLNCLAAGIDDSYCDGWGYSTHGWFTNLVEGTNVVMKENGNADRPTYVEYVWGNGKVIATMQTVEWGYGDHGEGQNCWAGPRPQLLRNELAWRGEWCATCYTLVWLPPIQVIDEAPITYTMPDGSTLPIKFAVFDGDGNFVVDQSVLVRILDPDSNEVASFSYGTGGDTDVRINDTNHYIVNLHTKDYAMDPGATYTIEVSFGYCVHTTTVELVEGGKAKGKNK